MTPITKHDAVARQIQRAKDDLARWCQALKTASTPEYRGYVARRIKRASGRIAKWEDRVPE